MTHQGASVNKIGYPNLLLAGPWRISNVTLSQPDPRYRLGHVAEYYLVTSPTENWLVV